MAELVDGSYPEDVLLSHPHDFFRLKRLGIVPGTCFVLMPFAKEFDLVYDTIESALHGLMSCRRADDLRLGRPILERVLRGIATAELIIADLTGQNPNVFYELALAHTRTKDVLLLTQEIGDVPFDLRSLFCHVYRISSRKEIEKLSTRVRAAAEEVVRKSLPKTIDGARSRTRRIVDSMRELLEHPDRVQNLIIRIQASISSLGNLGHPNSPNPSRREYGRLLEEERELLIRLIEGGAGLQAILSPHRIVIDPKEGSEERKERIDRVLAFLKEREQCMRRCEIVVSPVPGPNLLFLGEEILFEGHKTQVERGFGWTTVFTDQDLIEARVGIFDKLFESAREYTLTEYGQDEVSSGTSQALTNAAINAFESARNFET